MAFGGEEWCLVMEALNIQRGGRGVCTDRSGCRPGLLHVDWEKSRGKKSDRDRIHNTRTMNDRLPIVVACSWNPELWSPRTGAMGPMSRPEMKAPWEGAIQLQASA